nr:OsmC family peroxiredoxin [Gemmatimonadaceae bacterium]
MTKAHRYAVTVEWTGNRGAGTAGYRAYDRTHEISAPDPRKPGIPGSSDTAFRGDATRWNPEELLVASLSACHQLW